MSELRKVEKAKLRSLIKKRDLSKGIKNTTLAASALGTLGAGYLSFRRKKLPALLTGVGSIGSAYAAGRMREAERNADNRLKSYLEKNAVAGGIAEATSAAATLGAGSLSTLAHSIAVAAGMGTSAATMTAASVPLAIDLALLPAIAKSVVKSSRRSAYIAVKEGLGMPLTPYEKFLRGKDRVLNASLAGAEETKNRLIKKPWQFINQYLEPFAKGSTIGDKYLSPVLKKVKEYSPELAEQALNAIKDDHGLDLFKREMQKRQKSMTSAGAHLNKTIDAIPGLRKGLNALGQTGDGLISRIARDPRYLERVARKGEVLVKRNIIPGLKTLSLASALTAGTYMLTSKEKDKNREEMKNEIISVALNKAGLKKAASIQS